MTFVGEGHYPFAVIFVPDTALLKKKKKKKKWRGRGCVCVHCFLGWELGYKKADWNTGKQKI